MRFCTEAPNELQKLRNKAVCQPLDKHEASLELLYRYHDQLEAIEAKLPLTQTQIPVPFKWKDAFDKGSLFFGKASLTLSAGIYEKACVLFNIGALQSQIASTQQTEAEDGLKTAAKLFQMSSGTFGHLKETVLSLVQQEPTMDLMPDTLSALAALMLAQAQEAIYIKAAKDSMKPQIVAKIAAQAAELYQEAQKQMSREMLKSLWDKEWSTVVSAKQMAYQGLAQYQESLLSKEKKEIGEELSRLQEATAKIQSARKMLGPHSSILQTESNVVAKAYELAKKDNDFIYHERIPDIKTLPAISKAAVAKPLAPTSPMFPRFKDLFESLVPVAVHQALAAYDSRKSGIVNGEIGRLREGTQLMNGVLASLNLPAAIDDVCNNESLPESIREKSSKVRAAGGITALNKMHSDLPALLTRNKEIIEETGKLLSEEKSSDEELRNQYKEKWTRMASDKLTEPLWQEVGKYRQVLDTAQSADGIVRQKFDSHRQGMDLLSKDENELRAAIPGGGDSSGNAASPTVRRLKELMTQVAQIQSDRETKEKELKDTTFDMTSVFLKALAEAGALNEEQLSTEKLNELFAPLRAGVSESLAAQERLMGEVQALNEQFCREKGAGGSEREQMLKLLATAHDAYMELRANLQEGNKFYNDLTPLLVRLQQKVSDFCFARKTEKDDLLKDLTQGGGGGGGGGPPPAAAQGDQRAPPPRPPPPAQAPTAPTNFPPQHTYTATNTNPFYAQTPATTGQAPAGNPPPAVSTAPGTNPYPQNPPVQSLQYRPSIYSAPYGQLQQAGYPGQAQAPYPQQNQPYPYAPAGPPQIPGQPQQPYPGQQQQMPYPPAGGYAYQQPPGAAPQMPTGYNPYAAYGQPQQGYPNQQQPPTQPYPYGQNWPTM